jgi:hypothetical protein
MDDTGKKTIIGVVEPIIINSQFEEKTVMARIDSGATKSSINQKIAHELKLGPVTRSKLVRSAHGSKMRELVEIEIQLAGQTLRSEFTIVDRDHMRYPVLIGRNTLKLGDFLIDPKITITPQKK